jgi:uncharacterized membrane protein YkoI
MLKTFIAAGVILPAMFAADTETKIKMKDLPPAVKQAVLEQSKGAALKGLAREVEDGKTFYEAELKVNGRGKDVSFDEAGKVVSIEEEVALDSIPAAARDAMSKQAGTRKIKLVEKVTKGNTIYYEAHVKTSGEDAEIKVDSAGSPVK